MDTARKGRFTEVWYHVPPLHGCTPATVSGPGLSAQTTQTAYDADGNVAEVQQPNGDATDEFYDPVDQHVETFVLSVGNLTSIKDDYYFSDAAGNVSLTLDADGREHSSTLDGANREVQSTDTYTSTPALTTSLSYDPDGTALSRTVQSAGPTGQVQTATDTQAVTAADWPTVESDNGVRTSYGYDGAGQQRTQTILNG